MARCPICKTEQIGFNWTTTKSGKKWLQNASGEWHDCPMNKSKFGTTKERTPILKHTDYDFCHDCGRFIPKQETIDKYKLGGDNLERHVKTFHPNGEILDDIDYMAITDLEKEKVREAWNMPKIEKRYNLQGKKVTRV